MTFTVARNEKTSLYEVHTDGCKHLIARHMEVMVTGVQAPTGTDVARQSADENDGCLYETGPCAGPRNPTTYGKVDW